MQPRKANQSGITLVELLIATAVNVVLLFAIITTFSSSVSNINKTSQMDVLNESLDTVLQLMSRDISRAGYWANASNDVGTGLNNNPYQAAGLDVSIVGGTCILFSYDATNNGTLPAISAAYDDERYGYRLQGNVIQSRPRGASFSCAAALAAWETITDSGQILITGLTFTLTSTTVPIGAVSKMVSVRNVDISVSGRLTNDATITKTITARVRIRNDKYTP